VENFCQNSSLSHVLTVHHKVIVLCAELEAESSYRADGTSSRTGLRLDQSSCYCIQRRL